MKIYIAHSRAFDYVNELYKPLRGSPLNQKHEIILPHETDEVFNSKEVIKNVDLLVAEASYPATGLGIELGWADAYSTPIVIMHREDAQVSGSLRFMSDTFMTYSDSQDMVRQLEELMSKI